MPDETPLRSEPPHNGDDDANYPLTGNHAGNEQPSSTGIPGIEPEENKDDETAHQPRETESEKLSRRLRFKRWYGARKKWTIPLSVLIVIAVIAAVPWSRYQTAGLVMKNDLSLEVLDSKTNSPVSGALVSIDSVHGTTDGSGDVTLRGLKVGYHTVTITKKYYQDQYLNLLVPVMKARSVPKVAFVATGRQVKITVKDTITDKALSGVSIKLAGTEAKTDDDGSATTVVPADSTSEEATLSLRGYNDSKVSVKVSADSTQENDFTLTPAGKVYFLSRRTGKLNVMKANLDGTDAKVVLAGSGYERDEDSGILSSGDGKYVALLLKRASSDPAPQLYVLSTASDSLLNVDSGSSYTVLGWAGDYLIYQVTGPKLQQSSYVTIDKLKSYNAQTGKSLLLDQNTGSVNEDGLASYSYYDHYLIAADTVMYTKNWVFEGEVQAKQHTVNTISPDGQNHKVAASYDAQKYNYVSYAQHGPLNFYIWAQSSDDAGEDKFFDYQLGGTPQPSSITSIQFYRSYPAYFLSPSGSLALWSETRDGKNTILVGDAGGGNSKAIATLDGYNPYGWLTDKYVLLSKKDSQLYIMGGSGGNPVKVSDYQSTQGI